MILDKIAEAAKQRIAEQKKQVSLQEMKAMSQDARMRTDLFMLPPFAFESALKQEGMSYICEVKKASPSKGVIAEDFPYLEIAAEYEEAGASCVSVLTEPKYFLGQNEYLTEIKKKIHLPVIRKDFVVDEYQIYESKTIGADCVLLICAILDEKTIADYLHICDFLGVSALVEAHDEKEVHMAMNAGSRIIGVNNRNLKTFDVDINNSLRLRQLVPQEIVFVAESGIQTTEDIRALKAAKVDGVLIGETLMRAKDKRRELKKLDGKD